MITRAAKVSSTRIFARLDGDEQIIVYQNRLDIKEPAAMVLPIPEASSKEDAVKFINLKEHKEFFTHLDACFSDPSLGRRRGKGIRSSFGVDSLKVEVVGDFIASYVPTLADFERLDEQFRLSPDIWEQLPQYKDFGFVVFQFKSGKNEPHPMAFKFKTRHPKTVYFPTVHVHDGKVHETDRFDHKLFLQASGGAGTLATNLDDLHDELDVKEWWDEQADNKHALSQAAKAGVLAEDITLWRRAIQGELPNKDFYVRVGD